MLKWNVIYYNFNKKKIEEWNIFNHITYKHEVESLREKCKEIREFSRELERITMYYFWCKCEYEFIASAWPPREGTERKIDIYTQLKMNWDNYVEYLWRSI